MFQMEGWTKNPAFSFAVSEIMCIFAHEYKSLMLDRTQTIEMLKSTRQYLGEHYGVHSMTLFGSQ